VLVLRRSAQRQRSSCLGLRSCYLTSTPFQKAT
jgi:hypothetical protein